MTIINQPFHLLRQKRQTPGCQQMTLIVLAAILLLLPVSSVRATDQKPGDLAKASFDDILKYYQFVGDFSQHDPSRAVSSEFFWRYPFPLPRAEFPIDESLGDLDSELPATPGSDRPIQHMNYGRVLYREKNYEEARKVWLAAKARYGQNYDYHRRNDYFISLAYLKISERILKQFNYNAERTEVRLTYSNAATFLSWAFIKKKQIPDPMLDVLTPKSLYNLASIYFLFDRYNGAHSTAEVGLNFLRLNGRSDYRGKFRRIIAETWIRDHQYLKAIQQIDTMIRQDPDPTDAGFGFARAGDIYFDLNNYELAEEAYRISQAVHYKVDKILPLSFILRGESLFWMGRFSEAQKAIQFGLDSMSHRFSLRSISEEFRAWGALRLADAWLARMRKALDKGEHQEAKSLKKKAEVSYFNVSHEFPNSEAGAIAKVRLSCLMLPTYLGNNVKHARSYLNQVFNEFYSAEVLELAGSCEVLSYGQREKNQEFVDKVKIFYQRFPKSRFLTKFIKPLVEVRTAHLDQYLDAGDEHKAILYFEANRDRLFRQIHPQTRKRLFLSYLNTKQPAKAAEFYPDYLKEEVKSDLKNIILLTFYAEIGEQNGQKKWLSKQSEIVSRDFSTTPKLKNSEEYFRLFHRILQTKSASLHLDWIYRVVAAWSDGSAQYICNSMYPLLSRALYAQLSHTQVNTLWSRLSEMIGILFPALFNQSLPCSQALLDIERKIGTKSEFKVGYAKSWLNRLEWPHKKMTIPIIWAAAEAVRGSPDGDDVSDKLLKFLAKQDPLEFPEAGFARSGLDQQKTEVGELWDSDLK